MKAPAIPQLSWNLSTICLISCYESGVDKMMDNHNWRQAQPPQGAGGGDPPPAMEGVDWRAHLPPESRDRIVNKM